MSNIGLRVLSQRGITNAMNEPSHHSRGQGRPRTERHHRQRHRQHREQQRMWHACQDICDAYHGTHHDRGRQSPAHGGAGSIGDLAGQPLAGIPEQPAGGGENVDRK
jgi:hypothetical protein